MVPSSAPPPVRVLLVEDDPAVLQMAAAILRDGRHEIATATSAEDALARLEEEAFDVVFTDVVLPGASGLELASSGAIAAQGLPVLLTSGQRTPELATAISVTGLPFLPKPYTADGLRQALAQLVERSRERTA